MRKYDEIMEKIEVTPEMKTRILSEIDRRQIKMHGYSAVPLRLARRILPVAACIGILVLVLAVPQIRQNTKPQPDEQPPNMEGVYAPQEVASVEQLATAVGFSVRDIASLKEKAEETTYTAYADMAEIVYAWDGQQIYFRKSGGTEDNSGDYNTYAVEKSIKLGNNSVTLKGDRANQFVLAVWSDGTYSYSLGCAKPLKKADILGIIEEIEKNI